MMTEAAWHALLADPEAMARHQACEILRRPLDAWEAHVPASIALRRWAVAIVAAPPMSAQNESMLPSLPDAEPT